MKQREFTRKDAELNRKLVAFEDAIYALFAAGADGHRLALVTVSLDGYLARPGQLVRVMKAVKVLLPAPTIDLAGLPLVVWNRSGGSVSLVPVRGTINGAATATLAGQRAYRLQSDGTDYAGEF